jgi:hypothetical protein
MIMAAVNHPDRALRHGGHAQRDYITATYAKGIRKSVVHWKYAF